MTDPNNPQPPKDRKPIAYRVYPAVVAPSVLAIVAIGLAIVGSAWTLIALPFIYLGSVCAAPNLNLADGCLAYVAIIAGGLLLIFAPDIGTPILMGSLTSYLLSAVEKCIKTKPIYENDEPKE